MKTLQVLSLVGLTTYPPSKVNGPTAPPCRNLPLRNLPLQTNDPSVCFVFSSAPSSASPHPSAAPSPLLAIRLIRSLVATRARLYLETRQTTSSFLCSVRTYRNLSEGVFMSLTALAVVGRQGTPLYLRDYANDCTLLFDLHNQLGEDDSDIFGDGLDAIEGITAKQRDEWPCQMKYQFTLHSSCQRLDDVLRDNNWKAPGAVGTDACWVGLLCLADNLRAYGYVTTNAKYVTLVEDSIAPENIQMQKKRDNEICMLMANIHRLYTESLLNPFAQPHSKITSKRFESGVLSLVRGFNGR
ncbi:hypothetical protein ACHAWF_003261 [Thalassiosira exigua]